MKTQNYSNHIRFYAPHHFVFYPILTLLLAVSLYFNFKETNSAVWIFISLVLVIIIWLAFMLRQHYALILQNRIVRLEINFRYFTLTGERLDTFGFSDSQLFALRFAPDAELPDLVKRTKNQDLSGNAIKKAIVNWLPDHNRV